LQGNLYEPVAGMTFDRIVTHPPYVPSLESGAIYADGGADGESITRAIVEGLPRYLEPRGRFYCDTMGVEREGEPFEQRVREWLGTEHPEFDILFIADAVQGPAQFAYRSTRHKKGNWELMERWRAHLEKLKVKSLVNGLLVMQRTQAARSAFTVRRQKGEGTRAAEIEWLLGWETQWAESTGMEQVLAWRPLASSNMELHVVHTKRNEAALAPSKFTLRTGYPFRVEYECPAWVAAFVERCDGETPAGELFAAGLREQWIPIEKPSSQFVETIGELVSRGIIEIEGVALPAPTSAGAELQANRVLPEI